ncbi:MAG: hypothetical protein QOI86_311, partial [Actinomycetota bacterium]|nr:hypothetical protein [Actinomycetota bacterium]
LKPSHWPLQGFLNQLSQACGLRVPPPSGSVRSQYGCVGLEPITALLWPVAQGIV